MTQQIRVNVDPANPGQFFACCGLLEIADHLWPGAEGWFADGQFRLACEGDLPTLLSILVMDPPIEVLRLESNGLEVQPIIAPLAFTFDGGSTTGLVLDAWTRVAVLKGVPQVISNPPWNFWSGQQTSLRIWSGLRAELVSQLSRFTAAEYDALFSQRLLQRGRFGFDPGPAWNKLDVGFSPNEQGIEVESSPAVELLAAVGLQRFRPVMNDGRETFDYMTWPAPLSPLVAAAAMAGAVPHPHAARYRGCVVSRGQYAALGCSYPLRRGTSDE
jgi:hypothetical protein